MSWWRRAVFYEIYIRSFLDADGDGIGDLGGITDRLSYLADLGVDAIWITPFYPSPQVDFGYDVSDFEDVDPQYGTLAGFDRLIEEAHRQSLKVVVDVVLNHTSDRHAWFQASRTSRTSAFREWYIWRDGRDGNTRPPNNWESAFGGPAWTFDRTTGQWYYHFFYAEQPDLNWRHPDVEARMFAAVKFWIDRGVDGFRLDAVNSLFEDPALRDNPDLPEPVITLTGVRSQEYLHTKGLPELHDVLRRLRRFTDRHGADTMLVSEAYVDTVDALLEFYGDDDEMHLPFNFTLAQVPTRDAALFRAAVDRVERAFERQWPSLVLSNHDIDRAVDRYRGSDDPDAVSKLLAMLLLTLRGTPFLYYGEEIGMRTEPPARLEDVRDPVGRVFWPGYKGRDGVRRPMSWSDAPGAGFTQAVPWLAAAADSSTRNVARQRRQADSVLTFHRDLLHLRRASPALMEGAYRAVQSEPGVFAFLRRAPADARLVLLNMASASCTRPLAAESADVAAAHWRIALGTHRPGGEPIDLQDLTLAPLEALLLAPSV